MNIDKSKLQPLLWAVVGAWKAGDQDLHLRTDALDQFLGEHTVEQVALQLLAELGLSNEAQELYRADKIRLAHEVDRLRGENETLRKQVLSLSPFKGAPMTGPDTRCLACGEHHYGIGGLPCPKMKVSAQAVAKEASHG